MCSPRFGKPCRRRSISFPMCCLRRRSFSPLRASLFPFVYGPNEIMASIGRFAIAIPTFIVGGYLQLLVTPDAPFAPAL